ncbi:carbohydrate ABC transporter permease [Aeromicrobium sp.]|uniref:carbohydrate ABC transporter permease n=1 Tax=Aeromicrobium sp. TaxID=1871063 RepID=UPI002FCC8730
MLLLLTLPFLYPFVFLINTALKPRSEFERDSVSLSTKLTFENFASAWTDADLGAAMLHSVISVSIGVLVAVAISVTGAFWFVRRPGRWSTSWRVLLIATTAIPLPVYIIPLFLQLSDAGLTDNLYVMGAIYAGWTSSLGLYLVYTFLKAIPDELLEAAQLDGANPWQQLAYIVLPLCKPIVATLAVLAFVATWSDLLAGVVLIQDPEKRLLIPATALLNDLHVSNVPRTAAAVVIAMAPMFVVFLVGQRSLARGILAGIGK